MKYLLIFIITLTSSYAYAQQSSSTAIDRISMGFGQCIANGEKLADQLADLQKQLSAAQLKIKELEEKQK